MPVYDYACTACGRTIEVMHGVHAHGPATCEVCGGKMRKLLSPPAIVFKGSGWAKKDARAASRPRASKPSGGDSAGGSDTSTATSKDSGSSQGGSSTGTTGGSASE